MRRVGPALIATGMLVVLVLALVLVLASTSRSSSSRSASATSTPSSTPLPGLPGLTGPGDQEYRISAEYRSRAATLRGTETITFTNTRSTTLATVHLRLWPNGQTSCAKPFVRVSDVVGGTSGPLGVGCTALPVTLSTPLAPGATGEISFAFADTVPANWNFRYGTSGDAVMLGNAFPTLAPIDDEGIHLEPYTLSGESMYSLVASWQVDLTIPSGTQAATTGVVLSDEPLSDGRRRLQLAAPSERDFAMAIGTFTVASTSTDGVRIRYFKQRSSPVPAARVLRWAREAVHSFTEHYGPYDQPEIDLAAGTWRANGFEFPSMLMVDASRDVVYHEIAHLWWYSMVGDNQWSSPWVDESFTEFANQRLQGTNVKCNVERPFPASGGSVPLHESMGTFDARGHYVDTVYVGGPCVLEKLRRDWGDARFDELLSGLVSSNRGGVATTCGVIEAIRTARPPGYDVGAFLSWARLSSAGC